MRIDSLVPVYVETIPQEKEEGKIYICHKYNCAIHLCACGCNMETYTQLKEGEWTLTADDEGKVTLRPSIGNFKGQNPYHAHYFITQNKIEWL